MTAVHPPIPPGQPTPADETQSGYAEGPILPRAGEPGYTAWPMRVWPLDSAAAAPSRTVLLVVAAAVVGSVLWHPTVLSIGYLIAGLIVFGVVFGTSGRRPEPGEWLGIAVALALLGVPAVLDAGWLGALCVMAAWIVGWGTIVGGRTWTAVLVGPFIPWLMGSRLFGWLRRSQARQGRAPRVDAVSPRSRSMVRGVVVAAVTIGLVTVFGGLFASADPAFARLLGSVVPHVDAGDIVARAVVFGLLAYLLCSGVYVLAFRPRLDKLAPKSGKTVPTWEWAVPLAVLDALFVAFVLVQAAVLFGGHAHVLETEGLTSAEYARQGFWQLLWVAALTMVVLIVALRKAARESGRDRLLIRVLIGTLCGTSIVIVISAISRMWAYQQAYGFSVLRLLVITTEVWLGAVFVMIAVCGIRMAAEWLPRAVLISGALALVSLAMLNPERLIAERNIERYAQTGALDVWYLSSLSADIDPVLSRLPDKARACVARPEPADDPWYQFNWSRSRASAKVHVEPNWDGHESACSTFLGEVR